MRRRGRTDGNHTDVVKALRKVGASVQSLADVGKGTPDLLVGFMGLTVLLEVKDGRLPPSHRLLTPDEGAWMAAWRGGPLLVVSSVDEALRAIGVGVGSSEPPRPSLPPQNANASPVRRGVIG